jgi:hypothetical protein
VKTKICRWFHRWSEWTYEYEEMPDDVGEGTFELRRRHCTRKRCDMIEEGYRCVSSSPEAASGLTS